MEQLNLALRTRLDTLAKLAVVVLIQHSNHMQGEATGRRIDVVRMTAAELASRCGCHRVTAQRTLTALHQQGVLRRVQRGSEIVWDMLAALGPAPTPLAPILPSRHHALDAAAGRANEKRATQSDDRPVGRPGLASSNVTQRGQVP